MKKLVITLAIFLYSIVLVFGQADFRPGYYITNSNDTINGLIDYRSDALNANECVFRNDINSPVIKFKPDEIRSYRFLDNKLYVSMNLPNSLTNTNQKVFLEWLVKGKASILAYNSRINVQYFLLTENDSLVELKNTKQIVEINGRDYEHRQNEYKNVLKLFMKDCPELFEQINNTDLEENTLINLSRDYHNIVCKNESCIIYAKKEIKLGVSVVAGYSYLNSQTYMNNNKTEFIVPVNEFGYGMLVGLSKLPLLSENMSLQLGCFYFKNEYFFDKSLPYPYTFFKDTVIYKLRIYKLPVSLRYTFSGNNFKPFFELGSAYNIRKVDKFVNVNISDLYNTGSIHPIQISAFANVGLNIMFKNKLKIEASYCIERGFRFYGHPDDKSYNINQTINFLVGYQFN